jgi:hypothetical protein
MGHVVVASDLDHQPLPIHASAATSPSLLLLDEAVALRVVAGAT